MVLNAYGSAILKSEMDFSIWAMKKGIKNPVKKKIESEKEGETAKYNKLIEEGFEVHVSPFIHRFNGEPSKKLYDCIKREGGPEAEENYKIKRFLYQFIYIANVIGIEYAEKWINSYKEDKYRQEEYARMVKNKPKLAYCHLKSSNGQCRIDCPFWNGGCQISVAEEQQSRDLLEEYKPLERRR